MKLRGTITAIVLMAGLSACGQEAADAPAAAEPAEAAAAPAGPATIRVLTVGGTRIAMEALEAQYEAMSDNELEISFNNPNLIPEMMMSGEFDLVIAANNSVIDGEAQGLIEPETRQKLSRTGIGLSVAEGAAQPDISTPEAFRQTLLDAESIALTDPVNPNGSGIHTEKILAYAGVYDAVMAKATVQGLGDGKQLIADGERDLGLFNISEATAPGVVYVGPVPPVWQLYTNYDAAIFADSEVKAQAADLIAFLSSDAAEANWNAGGIDLTAE